MLCYTAPSESSAQPFPVWGFSEPPSDWRQASSSVSIYLVILVILFTLSDPSPAHKHQCVFAAISFSYSLSTCCFNASKQHRLKCGNVSLSLPSPSFHLSFSAQAIKPPRFNPQHLYTRLAQSNAASSCPIGSWPAQLHPNAILELLLPFFFSFVCNSCQLNSS